MANFHVYMLASRSRTLYTGVTRNLVARLLWHRQSTTSFAARYRCTRLVYVEVTPSAVAAFARESQIKGWRRARKIALIQSVNPGWDDLVETLGLLRGS